MPISQNTIDASVFSITGYMEFIVSITQWGLDIVGFFDKGANKADALLFALFGAPPSPTAAQVDLPNSNSGSISYSGSSWGKNYKPGSKVNDAIRFSASLQGTGELVRATL